MKRPDTVTVVLIVLAVGFAVGVGPPPATSAELTDHPMVSRFPGSQIKEANVKQFDEITLPAGPYDSKKSQFASIQRLEGKITRIQYGNPKDRSSLEIVRNYQEALQKAGFQILFACGATECADKNTLNYDAAGAKELRGWCVGVDIQCPDPMRYVLARLTRDTGDVYVAVQVWSPDTYLRVVEVKPMQTGMVTVGAKEMAEDITKTGHASIYGIYFDTGKSVIKPESKQAIEEIAKLLNAQPTLRLHVVGHTDNVGTLPSNMTLSKQRAEAVVNSLVNDYRVAAARLVANGVGPLAPVASNAAEEGRAKNRRVELVAQ